MSSFDKPLVRKTVRVSSHQDLMALAQSEAELHAASCCASEDDTDYVHDGTRLLLKNVHVYDTKPVDEHKAHPFFKNIGHMIICEDAHIIGIIPNDGDVESDVDEKKLYKTVINCGGGYLVPGCEVAAEDEDDEDDDDDNVHKMINGEIDFEKVADLLVYDKSPVDEHDWPAKLQLVIKQGVVAKIML